MRVRVRYTKTGKIRFVSAIDLGRLWERSLRRADLPVAYSEGFSPHPKISFPDALPLGYASTGEYAELTFAGPIALDPAIAALNAAFPPGMAVLAAAEVGEGEPRLSKWLQASVWDLDYGPAADGLTVDRLAADGLAADGLAADGLAAAAAALLAAERLPVARERKGEVTHVDLRPALHQISEGPARAAGRERHRCIRVTLHHTEPPMRPSEVHLAVASFRPGLAEPTLVTRIAQGRPSADGLIEAISGVRIPPAPTPTLEKVTTTSVRL